MQEKKDYPLLIQTILGVTATLTTGSVLWMAQTLDSAQDRLARIEEQVRIIGTDRYTATDANKDNQILGTRINNVERRLQKLEDGK